MDYGLVRQPSLFGDMTCITELEEIKGRTIRLAIKCKSADGAVRVLQLVFTDGTYCVIMSDNPGIDVNLMSDTERVIPSEGAK